MRKQERGRDGTGCSCWGRVTGAGDELMEGGKKGEKGGKEGCCSPSRCCAPGMIPVCGTLAQLCELG